MIMRGLCPQSLSLMLIRGQLAAGAQMSENMVLGCVILQYPNPFILYLQREQENILTRVFFRLEKYREEPTGLDDSGSLLTGGLAHLDS